MQRPLALFIPTLGGGGAQRVVVNLANAFVDIVDRPVHIILVRKVGPFLAEVRPDVRIVSLERSRSAFAVVPLARYLRHHRPVAVMASMNYANVVCALAHAFAGRPGRLVLREVNVLEDILPSLKQRMRAWLVRALMRRVYPFADVIVCNSIDTRRSLVKHGVVAPERCLVIGNPVALAGPDKCEGQPPTDPRACCEYPYICAIGRLEPAKGFDLLLEAFAQLQRDNLHLVVLGEGRLEQKLRAQSDGLGISQRVHFPGFVSEPQAVLERASLFVLSSRKEGFGNVLVEALSAGVPVVATDCPGAPRDILGNGTYGRLVPVDDVDALVHAIDVSLERPVSTPEARRERAKAYAPVAISKIYLEQALLPSE